MEQTPLRKSLKIYSALRALAAEKGYSGMAVRCWPEVFTDFGCAACGPMAMLNEEKVLETIIYEGLEHHISMTYGDCRPALKKLANMLAIQVLEIT